MEDQRPEIAHLQKESELKLITIEEKNIELQRKDAKSRLLILRISEELSFLIVNSWYFEVSEMNDIFEKDPTVSKASKMNDIFEKHDSLLEQVTFTLQRKTDTQTQGLPLPMGEPRDLFQPSITDCMRGLSHSTGDLPPYPNYPRLA